MIFSSQSWLSSLSSHISIARTELHLHLVSPLLGPARLLLSTLSILLVITATFGFLAAALVKRYSTSMVSSATSEMFVKMCVTCSN